MPVMDGCAVEVFHGTSWAAWQAIETEGLRPARAVLGHAVFASDYDTASRYAAGHIEPSGDHESGVVVAFHVPVDTRRVNDVWLVPGHVEAARLRLARVIGPGEVASPLGGDVARIMDRLNEAQRSMAEASRALADALS